MVDCECVLEAPLRGEIASTTCKSHLRKQRPSSLRNFQIERVVVTSIHNHIQTCFERCMQPRSNLWRKARTLTARSAINVRALRTPTQPDAALEGGRDFPHRVTPCRKHGSVMCMYTAPAVRAAVPAVGGMEGWRRRLARRVATEMSGAGLCSHC